MLDWCVICYSYNLDTYKRAEQSILTCRCGLSLVGRLVFLCFDHRIVLYLKYVNYSLIAVCDIKLFEILKFEFVSLFTINI